MKQTIAIYSPNAEEHSLFLPLARCMFETYYSEFGANPNEVEWIEPFDYATFDEVFSVLERTPPTVFGIGCYLWNVGMVMRVAEEVKRRWPSCIIVLGGPNTMTTNSNRLFKDFPCIDVASDPNLHNEWFITDLLDQLTATGSVNWHKVSGAIRPPTALSVNGSLTKTPPKAKFNQFVYATKSVYSLPWLRDYMVKLQRKFPSFISTLAFQSVRGCPYSCTFCVNGLEGTKISIKPLDLCRVELRDMNSLFVALTKKPTDLLRVLDLNYGQQKRDIELTSIIVDEVISKSSIVTNIGWSGLAKNKKEHLYDICNLIMDAGGNTSFVISLEDASSPEIKKNIERTDLPLPETAAVFRRIRDDFGIVIRYELIMGLPGKTTDLFYREADLLLSEFPEAYQAGNPFTLLQDSPASHPDYIARFGLEYDYSMHEALPWLLDNIDSPVLPVRNVVAESNSFSTAGWTEMFVMGNMIQVSHMTGHLNRLVRHLRETHSIDMGIFYKEFFFQLFDIDTPFTKAVRRIYFDLLKSVSTKCIETRTYVPEAKKFSSIPAALNFYVITLKQSFIEFVTLILHNIGITNESDSVEFYLRQTYDKEFSVSEGRALSYRGKSYRFFLPPRFEQEVRIQWDNLLDMETQLWFGVHYMYSFELVEESNLTTFSRKFWHL